MKKYILIIAILIVFCSSLYGQKENEVVYKDDNEKIFKGLLGFSVSVQELDEIKKAQLLFEIQFVTDIELKLRAHNIRVFSVEELEKMSQSDLENVAILYLVIMDFVSPTRCTYHATLLVRQTIWLHRNQEFLGFNTVWEKNGMGSCPIKDISNIRKHVGDLLDQLCNDYLKANTKKE